MSENGLPVCVDPHHVDFYNRWRRRTAGAPVRAVMRRQRNGNQNIQAHVPVPVGLDGQPISHSFQARWTHCVETCQWACGFPLGWAKFYNSESESQVVQFLETLWPDGALEPRPSFIAFDRACILLRYLANHFLDGVWIRSTRFIVDAFHYIGHSRDDVLCRTLCNPSPLNGSNPDLIDTIERNGIVYTVRAFNTETAEQFNSWLDGFQSQLSQMTDYNFDFFLTAMLHLHAEVLEKKLPLLHPDE